MAVELTLCTAAIILMLSLLIPTINKTREAARASQCKNNLYELALASQTYLLTYGSFPAGVITPARPAAAFPNSDIGLSWAVRLLPFIEQSPMYNELNIAQGVGMQRAILRESQIDVLKCFSNKTTSQLPFATSDFAGVHHHQEDQILPTNSGAFVAGRGLSVIDFTDGLSHTLQFGEKLPHQQDDGWMAGNASTLRNTGNPLQQVTPENSSMVARASTVVGGFGSWHPYGVNFSRMEGNVYLLAWNVDHTVLQRLADRADGELVTWPDAEQARAAARHPNSSSPK